MQRKLTCPGPQSLAAESVLFAGMKSRLSDEHWDRRERARECQGHQEQQREARNSRSVKGWALRAIPMFSAQLGPCGQAHG